MNYNALFSKTTIGDYTNNNNNKTSHVVPRVVDMVVLVGDLVDGRVDELKFAAEPLKELSPPKGKYFVTGKLHMPTHPPPKKNQIFLAELLGMTYVI